MKKLNSILILAVITFFFQSCGSNDDETTEGKNISRDTASKMGVSVEKEDARFAVDAASGGLTEVELGRLAMQRSSNKMLKNFGAMMVKDHSKANIKLEALAKAKSIALPKTPEAADQQVIDKLMKLWGNDFEKAYVSNMIDDHKNDIRTFEYASKNCSDQDIKAFAAKSLPVLKNHLDAINTIRDGMK